MTQADNNVGAAPVAGVPTPSPLPAVQPPSQPVNAAPAVAPAPVVAPAPQVGSDTPPSSPQLNGINVVPATQVGQAANDPQTQELVDFAAKNNMKLDPNNSNEVEAVKRWRDNQAFGQQKAQENAALKRIQGQPQPQVQQQPTSMPGLAPQTALGNPNPASQPATNESLELYRMKQELNQFKSQSQRDSNERALEQFKRDNPESVKYLGNIADILDRDSYLRSDLKTGLSHAWREVKDQFNVQAAPQATPQGNMQGIAPTTNSVQPPMQANNPTPQPSGNVVTTEADFDKLDMTNPQHHAVYKATKAEVEAGRLTLR